jgi:hypothetical protein
MAVGRRKLGWQLADKISVGLALMSFTVSAVGFPLPATRIKDPSAPFPCQDHACGCRSAEQCWRHCCCFTSAERWAWAKAHHIEPPAYAERPADHDDDHVSSACACHTPRPHEHDNSQGKPPLSVRWVLGFSALQCGGLTSSWIGSGIMAPPPPVTSYNPALLPAGWVLSSDSFPITVAICPLDPPPRSSCSEAVDVSLPA